MANTDNKMLFREKSLEAADSPEPLNEYIKVTTPGIWLVIAAVLMLVIGILAWIILGSQFDPYSLLYNLPRV